MDKFIERLLASEEPAVRYKVMVNVLGWDPDSGDKDHPPLMPFATTDLTVRCLE